MINGILVPADDARDPEPITLGTLEDMQRTVGGWLEVVDVPDTGTSLLVNEEGIPRGLPYNRRATHYWWLHNARARGRARLVGDVGIVGPVDDSGDLSSIDPTLRKAMLPGTPHRVEYCVDDGEWRPYLGGEQEYFEAVVWAGAAAEAAGPEMTTRVVRARETPRLEAP